jgi:hypothetical protein
MIKIFKEYPYETSILDDFVIFEKKHEILSKKPNNPNFNNNKNIEDIDHNLKYNPSYTMGDNNFENQMPQFTNPMETNYTEERNFGGFANEMKFNQGLLPQNESNLYQHQNFKNLDFIKSNQLNPKSRLKKINSTENLVNLNNERNDN